MLLKNPFHSPSCLLKYSFATPSGNKCVGKGGEKWLSRSSSVSTSAGRQFPKGRLLNCQWLEKWSCQSNWSAVDLLQPAKLGKGQNCLVHLWHGTQTCCWFLLNEFINTSTLLFRCWTNLTITIASAIISTILGLRTMVSLWYIQYNCLFLILYNSLLNSYYPWYQNWLWSKEWEWAMGCSYLRHTSSRKVRSWFATSASTLSSP